MFIDKPRPVRSQRLRESARNQPCALRIPGHCNGKPETSVLAHSPIANGGMATKGSDSDGVVACSGCHAAIDHRLARTDAELAEHYECWIRGRQETLAYWGRIGLIKVKGAE